jgi:hypothetical protein
VADWDAVPGRHLLRVRAFDREGRMQNGLNHGPYPDGSTGWHTVPVTVEPG